MPAYSFKECFVPFVLDGSKDHTIRKRRVKGTAKKGDTAYLYYALRTKFCKKLGEGICTDVKTIVIQKDSRNRINVRIYDRRLNDEEFKVSAGKFITKKFLQYELLEGIEMEQLAWRDGFRPEGSTCDEPHGAGALMMRWWNQTHVLPFVGDIIYWIKN